MDLETVRQAWDDYAKNVIPKDAPEVQRTESRRAFYAGAHVIMELVKRIGEPDIPEMAGVWHLGMVSQEIEQFYRDVKGGKA